MKVALKIIIFHDLYIPRIIIIIIQMSKEIQEGIQGLKKFAKDSENFLRACEKPDVAEFKKIATSCAIGFAIMGGIGYVVKLLFIPINNIILS